MTNSQNLGKHGKLYNAGAVPALTGVSRTAIHDSRHAGTFPAPAMVYNRGKDLEPGYLWREEDLTTWASSRRSPNSRFKGKRVPSSASFEDYATGANSGVIVCTISGSADGFLIAAKAVEYSAGGLTREEAAEVALKAAQGASRAEA